MARKKYDWAEITDGLKSQNQGAKKDFGDGGPALYKPARVGGKYKGLIRFLPSPDTGLPIATHSKHWFKGKTGKYVVEPCSYGIAKRKCPICAANQKFWDKEGDHYSPKMGRDRKSSKDFFANILVVKDNNTPANEGKVFLYRFPETIYKKIMQKVAPPKEEADFIKPVMIFDYDDGADFVLDITEKKDPANGKVFPNYDGSYFAEAGPIQRGGKALTDDELDTLEATRLPMAGYLDENTEYKTDAELVKLLEEADGPAFDGSLPSPSPKKKPVQFKSNDEEDNSAKVDKDLDTMFSGDTDSSAEDDDEFFKDL